MNRLLYSILIVFFSSTVVAQDINWPTIKTEAKPGSRWWWMGSAVDKENLTKNIEIYSSAGLGTLEITPIYGVQGNDENEIDFLTPEWMEMLKHTEKEAERQNMLIDMNNGTGWPFGGPDVSIDNAASKLVIREYNITGNKDILLDITPENATDRTYAKLEKLMAFSANGKHIDITDKVENGRLNWKAPEGEWRLIAAFCGKTRQKVKRAAPGGEGYVMNHLSAKAVSTYLNKFENAFSSSNTAYPNTFFNDSYEVYQADWTEGFFSEFAKRRGYKLEEHLPDFLSEEKSDTHARIISDYRETIGELLLENFTEQWTNWAHKHGTHTRNQAHGSPGNLIDLYATVDIPESEGFGLSDFGIKGLRKDSLTRPNDSDLSMLKYASSSAHIAGKPYTSSETFTWLTEHFRTSLSQCKPDMDLMFLAGINRMFFHGTTYSPLNDTWPGWKFYASIDMSPTNNIWRDAPAFFDYITRCQSFLQMGQADNDFLVYLPVYDMWYEQDGRLLMFDIHSMKKRAPRFINAVDRIINAGYDVDYISDNFIRSLRSSDGQLITSGNTKYKAIIIPGAKFMPHDIVEKLLNLANEGATVIFLDQYPEDVPGYNALENRREIFNTYLNKIKNYQSSTNTGRILFGKDYNRTLSETRINTERMRTEHGISYIRRSHDKGYHYFISVLQNSEINTWIPLAVPAKSVILYDPMTGNKGKAQLRNNSGSQEIYLQLSPGESLILKTFTNDDPVAELWTYKGPVLKEIELNSWDLSFIASQPEIKKNFHLEKLQSWTELNDPETKVTMATGQYKTTIKLTENPQPGHEWILDLGDVRESARIYVNGKEVNTLWAVPFKCSIGTFLKKGKNSITIEVTNLPANRIAEMDRKNIPWRKFKEINLVDIHYKATGYGHWEPVPSGLLGPIKLYEVEKLNF